jgi:hypothetical protein
MAVCRWWHSDEGRRVGDGKRPWLTIPMTGLPSVDRLEPPTALAIYLDMDDLYWWCGVFERSGSEVHLRGLEIKECRAMETNTCLGGERCMYIDPDDVRDRPAANPYGQYRGLNFH